MLRGTASGTDVRLSDGEPLVTAHATAGPVLVTFSPTAVTLDTEQPTGSARNRWHAVVRRVTPTGDVLRVQLEHPDLVADITPASASELGLEPGTRVWASVKATEVTVIAAGRSLTRR